MRTGERRLQTIECFCVALAICLGWALCSAPGAGAGEGPDPEQYLTVEHFLDMESISDPQISPNGKQIIYTRRWVNQMTDGYDSALWIMDSDGSRNRFLTSGSGARWSPDGTRILFMAEAESGGTQIFVRWMDAEGATTQVTRLVETPRSVCWSPDGRTIAFVMLTPAKDAWKIKMPSPPKGADWIEGPKVIDRMHYRQDRRGFMADGFYHLFTVPADGGTPRQLTKGDWHVGSRPFGMDFGATIDWTPDGRNIVFDALQDTTADERYRESHIYIVDAQTKEIRQITTEKGPWTGPVVSPDGQTIAYTGFPWTEQTYRTDELYVIGIDGGEARPLTASLDRSPEQLHWSARGRGVYFTAQDRGARQVYFASTAGKVDQLTTGSQQISLSDVSDQGVAVGVLSDVYEPGTLVRFNMSSASRMARLTQVNEDVLGHISFGEVEEIWYPSSDGTRVQGWLVKPPDFSAERKYPLILHIHGGPHAMYSSRFSFSFQNFAADGYLVMYANPRGSSGYGTDFGNAIDNAYPSVDYEDLMSGVDTIIARGCVDTDRLYVTGVSGGGVLSSWIIGHTDRFAAAAVRAPVINWISFAGTTDITAWGYSRFRTRFWKQPQRWLDCSPLMYVENVTTPTLLMTGELDLRTPMGQTEEYYQALKALGVETVMLRFQGEYHGTGRIPSNFMRTQLYLMSWFEKHSRAAKE